MSKGRKIAAAILISRPQLWLASAVFMILSAIVGAGRMPSFKLILVLAFVGGPGICGASEALNDYFDQSQDGPVESSRLTRLRLSGGTAILQRDMLSPASVLFMSLFLIATAIGLSLLINRYFFALSVIAASLAISYSAPPIRLKGRGFLSAITKAFAYGFLIFHGGYVATGGCVTSSSLAMGSALSLLALGNTQVFDLHDFEIDSINNTKTFPVQLGLQTAKVVSALGIVGCFLVTIGFSVAGVLTISPFPFWSLCTVNLLLSYVLVRSEPGPSTEKLILAGIPMYALAPLMFVPL